MAIFWIGVILSSSLLVYSVESVEQHLQELHCKPKPGCTLAKCDPMPDRWSDIWAISPPSHEYPILCQREEDLKSMEQKMEEMKSEIKRDHLVTEKRAETRLAAQITNLRMEMLERIQELNSAPNRDVIQTLRRQVEMLEGKLQELTSTVNREVECEDGFVYREKCYFANIYPTSRIQFQHKESNCSAKGGKVGSILNREHQILAENYVRPRIPGSSIDTQLWLASIYSHSTETFITPEGHSFPSTSIRWHSNYPKSDSTKTAMLLNVKPDKTSDWNGVWNDTPDGHTLSVFCEK